MLQGLRGILGRPHAAVPCLQFGGSRFMALNRSPFVTDQNEDGFMVVGSGVQPSSLRPNLNKSSSTTSDENWAQILRDVDPPSYNIVNPAARLAMRPVAPLAPARRRQGPTHIEQRAMDDVFERVFNMDAPSGPKTNNFLMGALPPLSAKRVSRQSGRPEELELLFDSKREAILNCKSDQELLRWTMKEVFQEPPELSPTSPKTETATLKSTQPPESAQPPESVKSPESAQSPETVRPEKSSQPTKSTLSPTPKPIHPGIYARVIALLMAEFREKYRNPHLAIAIFDHTRRRSIISFVTGCTTPSYTELMRSYWTSFRDLRMVLDTAEEMRVNGVPPDDRTYQLFLQIQEEVDKRATWIEGGREELLKQISQLEVLMKPRNLPKSVLV